MNTNWKIEIVNNQARKGRFKSALFDLCGAGDANTSGIISALCCKSSLYDAALLGNIISSITIQELNTIGTVSSSQVLKRYREAFN